MRQRLLSSGQRVEIIDVSHDIRLNNTIEAAFMAGQLQNIDNQENVLVISMGKSPRLIVYQHLLNLYILPDNGLLTMLLPQADLRSARTVAPNDEATAIRMFREKKLDKLPLAGETIVRRYMKQAQVNGNYITTEFIYADKLGNCYFDLRKSVFDEFAKDRPCNLRIQHYTGLVFDGIGRDINDVSPGEAMFGFNSGGYLRLQMNMGNARQLFRIKDETKIIIERT